jgi:Protein phosphatase 2C
VAAFPDPEFWDIPDTVVDGLVLRGQGNAAMELRAASVRGRSHRFYGKVRQDAYAFRCDGHHAVVAVADGLGSAPLSHVAAITVARWGAHEIITRLANVRPEALDWWAVLQSLSARVVTEGRAKLGQPELPGREVGNMLAATALFAVVGLAPVDGHHLVHLFAYGDSSAWVLRAGQHWEPMHAIKNHDTELASSATPALPYLPEHPPAPVRTALGPTDVLLLVSDGVGDPLGDGAGTVGGFLAEHWRRPPEPLAFAAQVDFARKSHDDDRTAVAMWPGFR